MSRSGFDLARRRGIARPVTTRRSPPAAGRPPIMRCIRRPRSAFTWATDYW